MKKFTRKLKELTPEDINGLVTIFLASVLGSLFTTAFMTWVTEDIQRMVWTERILLSLVATGIYASVVVATFYVFSPESRPALKRLITRRD